MVGLKEEEVLPLNDTLAWNPNAEPLKDMYDQGEVAIVQGIGYPIQPFPFPGDGCVAYLRTDRNRHGGVGR